MRYSSRSTPSGSRLLADDDGAWHHYPRADPGLTAFDGLAGAAAGAGIDVGDATVHVRGANDSDPVEPVSFGVEHDAGTLFHGGDSRPAEAFAEIRAECNLDLSVLAFGSVGRNHDKAVGETSRPRWYVGENEVIEAANALGLGRVVPSHWGR